MIPSIKTHIVTRFTVSSCLYKKIPKITPEIMLFRVKPGKNGPLGLTIYWIMSEIPPTTPPTRGPYSIPVKAKAKKLKDISIIFENTTAQERTQAAVTFMNHIKNAGYQAMVYSSSQLFETVFEMNYLHDYDFWVAEYSYAPNFSYHFSIWQYTDSGSVNGISTNVDMNIMFVKK